MARVADVVILSVPIPEVNKLVRAIAPHLRPDAALMDLTSVKQGPVSEMLAHFPGEVVGTHPLFGPGAKDLAATPWSSVRTGRTLVQLAQGPAGKVRARVKVTSAKEHDRLMSVVQGLAHFTLIALEMSIRELGVAPEDLEDFATPTFSTLHNLARRLFTQDAKLYACIQLQNPANRAALRALEDSVADILYFIQRQNADGLVKLIESVRKGSSQINYP